MMSKYTSIIKNAYSGDYDLVSVVSDSASLVFRMERSNGDAVEVKFSRPAMYAVMNESFGLTTFKEGPDDIVDGSLLFKVDGGIFLNFFHDYSLRLYEDSVFEHYVIMSIDDVVHVIAYEPPVVSQFPAG